jgi:hypothetical protein
VIEIACLILGVILDQPWFFVIMGSMLVPIMIASGLLYRNWPTCIRVDESTSQASPLVRFDQCGLLPGDLRSTIRAGVCPLLPDGVIIVYDGGVLTPAEVKEIVLANGELAGYEFVTADEAAGLVTPLVARQITACLEACEAGTVAALENGRPVALHRLLPGRDCRGSRRRTDRPFRP